MDFSFFIFNVRRNSEEMFLCVCLRWTYQEFFSRYRVLMKQKDVLSDKKLTCKNVLEKLVQVSQTVSVLPLNH